MEQGKTLKKLVENTKLTQQEFADKLGISRNYLLILFDKKTIKEKYIDSVCKIANVNKSVFTISQNEDILSNKNQFELENRLLKEEIERLNKYIERLEGLLDMRKPSKQKTG